AWRPAAAPRPLPPPRARGRGSPARRHLAPRGAVFDATAALRAAFASVVDALASLADRHASSWGGGTTRQARRCPELPATACANVTPAEVTASGFVTGCSSGTMSPGRSVTRSRGDMSTELKRTETSTGVLPRPAVMLR